MTGPCCIPLAGGLVRCVQVTQADCAVQGGAFFGIGLSCSDPAVPCNGGMPGTTACCLPDGTCLDLTPTSCQTAGGSPSGPMSSCNSVSCEVLEPVGACCDAATGACRDLSELDYILAGGVFSGPGTGCGGLGILCSTPVAAACCLPDGSCVDTLPAICTSLGGIPNETFGSCRRRATDYLLPRADFDGNGILDGRDLPGFVDAMVRGN